MGLFSKKAFEHVWIKKEVDVAQLKEALEGNTSTYTNDVFHKIAKKYQKYDKRGASNLYLVKEAEDDGIVCAVYAFSITDGIIDDETLTMIQEAAMRNLSVGEMQANAYDQKPTEWWETEPEFSIARLDKGKPDGFMDYLIAELAPKGIILTERQVRKSKLANELECSAVAWGIKESGLRKGVKSRIIHNDCL